MEPNKEENRVFLREQDVEFETMKSSGPGGQNVNKRATAVRLRASIENLNLSDQAREAVRENLPPRHVTKGGELIIENSESRSQEQNRKNALRVANEEIGKALDRAKEKKKREKHKKRARKAQNKGGGSGEGDSLKEKQKRARRSETTDDLLEQAYQEDPDLRDRLGDD